MQFLANEVSFTGGSWWVQNSFEILNKNIESIN